MQILPRMNIGQKLILIFSLSILFIGAIIAVGVWSMQKMKGFSQNIFEENFNEAQRFLYLDRDLEKARRGMLALILEPDKNKLAAHLDVIAEATQAIDGNLEFMLGSKSLFKNETLRQIHKLKALWEEFKERRDAELIPAVIEGRSIRSLKLTSGRQEETFRKFITISEALVSQETGEAQEAQQRVNESFTRAILLFSLIAASGLLLSVPLLLYFSTDIRKRLKIIVEAVSRVKAGDLDFKIEDGSSDEIGFVTINLNKMIRQLYEDRIMQDQSMSILQWYSDESAKEVKKLEKLNTVLTQTQEELNGKNRSLEESLDEIKIVNKKLADTKAQMIQSEKMASIGLLSAGVAHEINTPIGFVSSNLHSLDGYIKDISRLCHLYRQMCGAINEAKMEEAVALLNEIEVYKAEIDIGFIENDLENLIQESREGIERVVAIVRGLKDFSHLDGGEMHESDLNKNLDNTITLCRHELKLKAEIIKEFGALPLIYCHAHRLSQVFVNLLVNAAQAIPERGRISIKTFEENGEAVIEISDTGSGMPEEIIPRIFEPFFTTKPVGEGTGLGLSIVYGIIRDHDGSIDVRSRPGEGTTFIVRLPVQRAISKFHPQAPMENPTAAEYRQSNG